VDYAVVAEAYRDLEAAGGRLALIDRMAALLGETPDDELATVCYLCQGQIAPEHAGIDLGLASKLAMRSVGVATGKDAEAVTAAFLEAGDLGEAAEAVLPDRMPSLTVGEVVETLHEIARSEGIGSQGRKIDLLAGLLARATPLEARYLLRLVTGSLRLGIGTPTILEEPAAPVPAPRRRTRAPDRLLLPRCGRTSAQRPRASAPSASSMVSASCRLPCRSRPAGSKASRPATAPGRADHAAGRSRWVRTSDNNGVHRGE